MKKEGLNSFQFFFFFFVRCLQVTEIDQSMIDRSQWCDVCLQLWDFKPPAVEIEGAVSPGASTSSALMAGIEQFAKTEGTLLIV